jgi:hypothetical protein
MIATIVILIAGAATLGLWVPPVALFPMSALVLGIVFYADVSHGDPGWQVVRDLITVTVSVELGYIIGASFREVWQHWRRD